MKATEARLLDFLKKSPQFTIPIYQRTYSWTDKQCTRLWDDIVRTGSNDEISAHFMGSIVYIEESLYQVSAQSPLLVIDGQQRLTAVSLLIEVLARRLGTEEPVDGFSAQKLRSYYLLNPLEQGDRNFKLILTQTDKDTLLALVNQKPAPDDNSVRVQRSFDLFKGLVADLGDDLTSLCKGLAKLFVVDISLSRDQDNPQLIFESMNSTGLELTQADLIRNFVLMDLEPELQTRLYQDYWRPMEVEFGQKAYGRHFDAFMRHYLIVKTGEIPRERDVYEAFKEHSRRPGVAAAGVEALVREVREFAGYYCAMALRREPDKQLAAAFHDLRELRVEVAYPLLLELYRDYKQGSLTHADFLAALRLVEAYVFRRAVCSIPTNSLNKTFANFARALDRERHLESIKAHLMLMPSYRRFPSDEEFGQDLTFRDLYNFRSRSYLLRRLENHERKEPVPVDEYTIEHILPQNENLSPAWQSALGEDWKTVQDTWLHTLGNLTLTGYNSEYSDRPFQEKRDMPGGFSQSPLKLNEGLGQLSAWDEAAIKARADLLAKQALDVWKAPSMPKEALERYRPEVETESGYAIDDHRHLAGDSPMRPIFDAFRKETLALDPCVTEEFLKLYVAYKAETNFVDVVPQAKRLRLSLNMAFHEVDDPRGLCKDVTEVGRWGNGDVEVGLDSLEQLAYVMGLVGQAFEKQMGDGDDPE